MQYLPLPRPIGLSYDILKNENIIYRPLFSLCFIIPERCDKSFIC